MSMYGKKTLQYCKVISLQLIKIHGKKKIKSKDITHQKKKKEFEGFLGLSWWLRDK